MKIPCLYAASVVVHPWLWKNLATIIEKLNFYVYMYLVEQVTQSVSA